MRKYLSKMREILFSKDIASEVVYNEIDKHIVW